MDGDDLALTCHLADGAFNPADGHEIRERVCEQCCSCSGCVGTRTRGEREARLHLNASRPASEGGLSF